MRSLLAFGFLAAWALSVGAQEPSPQARFDESIDVRVVNVEAVVTDAKGNRVRGLTAKDFQLEVDGKEVPVEFFAEVAGGEVTRPAGEGGTPVPAVPEGPPARNLLVFIDDLFSIGTQRDAILAGLERDLKLLGPEDRMAIVALGTDGRPAVLSRWTNDRSALSAALAAARKRRAWGNDVSAARRTYQNDQELIEAAMESNDLSVYDNGSNADFAGARGMDSLFGLQVPAVDLRLYSRMLRIPLAVGATMRSLTPPPGRKVLLLLSGGWPIARLMIPIFVEANRLGYTAYPVDVQGIDSVITRSDAIIATPGSRPSATVEAWQQGVHYGMEILARATGGQAILNTAPRNTLARVVEDTSSFYWLGFTPAWKGDDRHHRVVVKTRGKSLAVRARRGYSDVSRATQTALTGYATLLLGGDPKDKRLTVEPGTPEKGPDDTMSVLATVVIPVADLTPVERDGGWLVEAVLAGGALDKHGGFSDPVEAPLRITLPQAPQAGDVSRYSVSLKLRRIQQRLVFTVRDPLTETVLWGEADVKP